MATIEEAQDAWTSAVASRSGDAQASALLGGVNVRINVAKALKATYLSAKLYVEGKLALATGALGPLEIANLGKGVYDIVVATLDALRERMHPLEYAVCLVLAGHEPAAMTEAELEAAVRAFVEDGAQKLPWHMGITDGFLAEARKALGDSRGFARALEQVRDDRFVVDEAGKLRFVERHFEWGFRLT